MRILKVEDVSKSYVVGSSKIKALESVSFSINEGEFTAILGPSGCGKTTLLNIIAGLLKPDAGNVEFAKFSGRQGKPKIAYVFQQHRLLPWKTAEENIRFVLKANRLNERDIKKAVDKYIELVGMEHKRRAYPWHMSEGERQRISIARALSINPDLILMDEPLSHLDEITARILREEIIKIWRMEKKTIIYVTHNALEATYLAEKILIMSKPPGKIIASIKIDLPYPRAPESEELSMIREKIISAMESGKM